MIRKSFLIFATLLLGIVKANSQMVDPIKWEHKVVQKGNQAELIFTAILDPEWHIYSQDYTKWDPTGNDGPLPTVFNFSKMKDYSLVGAVKEPSNGHEDKM